MWVLVSMAGQQWDWSVPQFHSSQGKGWITTKLFTASPHRSTLHSSHRVDLGENRQKELKEYFFYIYLWLFWILESKYILLTNLQIYFL